MEEADQDLEFGFDLAHAAPPPALVSLVPFSPIPSPATRRLSSSFTQPSHPVRSARQLAWVSLQGRLVNAEEASSARAIGGGLCREEAVAWELFTPIQRFLIVAVIGVAVAESKKNRKIWQLKKSVELRDQVLLSMQEKLDNLCEQLNNVKHQPSFNKNVESPHYQTFGPDQIKFVDCGCWLCDQHHDLLTGLADNSMKATSRDDMLQYKMPSSNDAEQEERRMSDLSDWASSVTSAAEVQMNNFAIEQDIFNLKKECEDKDATIKELSTILQSSNVAGSKRIGELEDIIRRKNIIITRLKKDMMVLEQKVVHLTRMRRPSSSALSSSSWQLPVMADNLLYDMDSTTGSSSSDSDSSPKNQPQAPVAQAISSSPSDSHSFPKNLPQTPVDQVQENPAEDNDCAVKTNQKSMPSRALSSLVSRADRHTKSRSVSPLKEISTSKSNTLPSLGQKQSSASEESKKSRRRNTTVSKAAVSQKRWI